MNVALLPGVFTGELKEATQITVFTLAQYLKKGGFGVLIVSEPRGHLSKKEVKGQISIFRGFDFRISILNKLFSHFFSLRKIKKKMKIDVLHGFSSAPVMVLRVLLPKFLFPKAKTVHTIKSYSMKSFGGSFAWLLNFAGAVIVQTEVAKKKLISKGVKSRKIHVIHSHIDTERFCPGDRAKIKKELGLGDRKLVVYYGAMRPEKGVDALMGAAKQLRTKDVEFLFLSRVVNYYKRYDDLIKGFNAKIITKDVPIEKYVMAADLVVLAYPTMVGTEGNPSCLLEAMACKTPVITTRLPEIQEIVTEEEVEFVNPGDVPGLAKKIESVLENPDEKKCERAWRKAQEFSIPKITKQITSLYRTLWKY